MKTSYNSSMWKQPSREACMQIYQEYVDRCGDTSSKEQFMEYLKDSVRQTFFMYCGMVLSPEFETYDEQFSEGAKFVFEAVKKELGVFIDT